MIVQPTMFTLKQSNRLGLKQWKFFRQFEWKQAVKSPGVHVLRPTLPADGVRQNSRVSMLLVSIPHLKALRNCDFGAPHVLHLILAAVAKRPTYAWGQRNLHALPRLTELTFVVYFFQIIFLLVCAFHQIRFVLSEYYAYCFAT